MNQKTNQPGPACTLNDSSARDDQSQFGRREAGRLAESDHQGRHRDTLNSPRRSQADRSGRVPSPRNVGEGERFVSAILGGYLCYRAVQERNLRGVAIGGIGLSLLRRSVTGSCPLYKVLGMSTLIPSETRPGRDGVRVYESITVNRPPSEVYDYWRKLENLPQFMRHLQSVSVESEKRSHWIAKAPAGLALEWDAQITEELRPHHISWESLPGAALPNSGAVGFLPAANGKATEVKISLRYDPPAGKAGMLIAKLFGRDPSQEVAADLRRFKQMLETGEITTNQGQARGPARTQSMREDGYKDHART